MDLLGRVGLRRQRRRGRRGRRRRLQNNLERSKKETSAGLKNTPT